MNVSHDRDLVAEPAQAFAHHAVPRVLAMRKVEPSHIHTGSEELRQTLLGIRSQTDGANDFGATRGLPVRYFADQGNELIGKGIAFDNIVARPFMHGFHHHPNGLVFRDNHDLRGRGTFFNLFSQQQTSTPARLCRSEIDNDDVEMLVLYDATSAFERFCLMHVEVFAGQNLG